MLKSLLSKHLHESKKRKWEKTDVWVRATVCFRKIDGQWKVTHEHISVPFDMETFKASVHLKP